MKAEIKREERTESILLSLKTLDYLTRSQIQVLHDIGSSRSTSRIMKELEDAAYVNSFRDGEKVYYLSREGRDRIGASRIRKKTLQARHFIMRNSLYIAFGSPSTWKNEQRFAVKERKDLRIIADATFVTDGRYHIVEIDHTQKMSANRAKIEKYRKLIEIGAFKVAPRFVWMTVTDYRRKQLTKLCEGLDVQIFTVNDFH